MQSVGTTEIAYVNKRSYEHNDRVEAFVEDADVKKKRRQGVIVDDEDTLQALARLMRPDKPQSSVGKLEQQSRTETQMASDERRIFVEEVRVVKICHGARLVDLDQEKKVMAKVQQMRMTEAAVLRLIG